MIDRGYVPTFHLRLATNHAVSIDPELQQLWVSTRHRDTHQTLHLSLPNLLSQSLSYEWRPVPKVTL